MKEKRKLQQVKKKEEEAAAALKPAVVVPDEKKDDDDDIFEDINKDGEENGGSGDAKVVSEANGMVSEMQESENKDEEEEECFTYDSAAFEGLFSVTALQFVAQETRAEGSRGRYVLTSWIFVTEIDVVAQNRID
jgi:hypothetical protein